MLKLLQIKQKDIPMRKALILAIIFTINILAYQPSQLYGEWIINRVKNVSGTINKEEQIVRFQPATVQIILNTTVKRGNYLIKNLKIIADGTWKLNNNMLVLVLQQVRVPEVGDVKGFNQNDINTLASKLRKKFLDDSIKMFKITTLDGTRLILLDEDAVLETYKRR